MRTALFVNAGSRSGKALFGKAQDTLVALGAPLERAEACLSHADLHRAIERAIADGVEKIILGGGDGTISSSSRLFVGTDATMAMLPLGTANSFARTIGLPLDMEGACEVAVNGAAEWIDLGQLGRHYFTNAAAIGLPAEIGRTVPDQLKRVLGRFGYLVWAIYKLARFRGFTCLVEIGGMRHSYDAVEVRIANGRYLGGLLAAPDAEIDDNVLVVQIVRGVSGFALAKAWAHMATGTAPEVGEITELKAARCHIETRPLQPVSIDGEVLARTPTEVTVRPRALRLMVPRESAA